MEERPPEGEPLLQPPADLAEEDPQEEDATGAARESEESGMQSQEAVVLAADASGKVLIDCKTTNKGIRVHR